jgi:hypothetical protein
VKQLLQTGIMKDINSQVRALIQDLAEQHGLDSVQVLFSRQEGNNTITGTEGVGNFLARVRMCESFILRADLIDQQHYKQELE